MRLLSCFLVLCFALSATMAQVPLSDPLLGVRPDSFPEKLTAEANDEFYSQAQGIKNRIRLETARSYFLPEAYELATAAPGNWQPADYSGAMVRGQDGYVWYVDAASNAHPLAAPAGLQDPSGAYVKGYVLASDGSGGTLWRRVIPVTEKYEGHTGSSLSIATPIIGNSNQQLLVTRSGLTQTEGRDYNVNGQTLSWARATDVENVIVVVR